MRWGEVPPETLYKEPDYSFKREEGKYATSPIPSRLQPSLFVLVSYALGRQSISFHVSFISHNIERLWSGRHGLWLWVKIVSLKKD